MSWIVHRVLLVAAMLVSVGASALAQETITLLPYSSEAYGIESVVPEGWHDVGRGIYARQQDANDRAVLAQQSAPASVEDVLASLVPQLGLSEAPRSIGTYQSPALDWTLYKVDVTAGGNLSVDLALAHEGGTTSIVLLQAPADEYETLHESVFLPALDAFAPLVVAEEPVPYQVEDVTFTNGDVTLAGTLTLPPGPGPHPAIVLVSGSGPQDRDETLGGGIAIKPFRLLADAITRAGGAVLRYDDRGVGQSTGTFSTATTQDFASDAEAAIRYLTSRDDVDPNRIGLLGHSEGGMVAAMLGARDKDLDFIISLAGPGVNGHDVLLLQNRRLMEAEGATQAQIDDQVAFVEKLIAIIDDPKAVEALVYQHTLDQIKTLPEEERAKIGDVEQYAHAVAKEAMQQFNPVWFKPFLAYDPAPDWEKTTVPVLALFGGKDVQVDAEQNAPPMAAALLKGGNHDVEVVVLPNANHLFQAAQTGAPSEYATLPAEFTPGLIPTIVDWLDEHVTTAKAAATPVTGS
jgi:pimeloyl-ACP methyl ester carboxylesterase